MKRVFYLLLALSLIYSQTFAANEWQNGTGEDTPLGTENAADIDTVVFQRVVDPLDRLLSKAQHGARLAYASASTVTIGIGEVTCQNSAGTIKKFRANTTATTLTWSNIDTGSEAISTIYYVYAVADADAATFTGVISTSSTTPSGVTYYKRLGQFYNDASGNITSVLNDDELNILSGSYTGDGTASRTITLGATPFYVEVFPGPADGTASKSAWAKAVSGWYGTWYEDSGGDLKWSTDTALFQGIVSNGFKLGTGTGGNAFNASGTTYYYLAMINN